MVRSRRAARRMKRDALAVKEVKEAVREEPFQFEISTRRTKSGNLLLETSYKEHADDLASALKRRLGESRSIRRPSPSVALLLIGIEDSIDEKELERTLVAHDPELKAANDLKIREGKNGIRTAIAKVPPTPGLKLAHLKSLRVGWAMCRIKELTLRQGCAKCSAPGHATSECKGEETRRCYKCKTIDSVPGVKVLQVNLNHCWMAQQLLLQTVVELNIDVVIVSDYNRPLGQAPRWVASADSKCAVYVPGRSSITVTDQGFRNGFTWVKVVASYSIAATTPRTAPSKSLICSSAA
ncbi:hypothetical protein QTP88_029149 [Uroleucon formosanum]